MAPIIYQRRQPEKTVLYEVIRRHYTTFKATVDATDRTLPAFVEREFEKYLACGILAHGFARCHCDACGFDRIVAFSCKCRGWCPSCIGRRMADTAACLTDRVLPDVPMRTWTLTLPHPLRYLAAYNPEILGKIINAFAASLLGWMRHKTKRELGLASLKSTHPGMITWVQRFGSAANLNVHLHVLATEGVFVEADDGKVTWHTLPEPSSAEVAQIAWATCERVVRLLKRLGMSLAGDDVDEFAEREPLLAACYAASLQGFIATGKRAGQQMMQMGVAVGDHENSQHATPAHGFNLFAGKCISAFDRKKREHVIRYMARPPIPNGSLSFTDDGHVLLRLKNTWSNGATHVKFTGPELIERLVSLVPRPRVNLVRHHGVFAPHARLRPAIVPSVRTQADAIDKPNQKKRTGRYLEWAELLARVFEVDVTVCPRCGTRGMQMIAAITHADAIRDILTCIGEPTAPPALERAQLAQFSEDAA